LRNIDKTNYPAYEYLIKNDLLCSSGDLHYIYNPKDDSFVTAGNGAYFVSDVKMELVSNYISLGKLIQDIYQYPYYIKICNVEIKPYAKDKKILLTNMTLRLYAHTDPIE
jgi:hypothetical protein